MRPGAYPRVEHLQGALLGEALALPVIIRLGLPVTNTLAYYISSSITDRKSFITLGPAGEAGGFHCQSFMLSFLVFMLSVIMLNVVMLSVVAPSGTPTVNNRPCFE